MSEWVSEWASESVSEWVSKSVIRSPIELFWTAKKIYIKKWLIEECVTPGVPAVGHNISLCAWVSRAAQCTVHTWKAQRMKERGPKGLQLEVGPGGPLDIQYSNIYILKVSDLLQPTCYWHSWRSWLMTCMSVGEPDYWPTNVQTCLICLIWSSAKQHNLTDKKGQHGPWQISLLYFFHICNEIQILSSRFTHLFRKCCETEKQTPQTFPLLECMPPTPK